MKDCTLSQDDDESEDEGLEEVIHQQEENLDSNNNMYCSCFLHSIRKCSWVGLIYIFNTDGHACTVFSFA